MTDDRLPIDAELVRRLVAAQFPQWTGLPIRPVAWDGWDNRTFHLGETMKVRLPSAERYVAQVAKEQRWLPVLAPRLPLPVPTPLALGHPGEGYPWRWSIYDWLDGDIVSRDNVDDRRAFAVAVAGFLLALERIDASHGPHAGAHTFFRGGSLQAYDAETRQTIAALGSAIDGAAAIAAWDAALAAGWRRRPVWVHGDVAVGNLLVRDGRLSAVIDFGGTCVGDPACDLVISWLFFEGESREAFRATMAADGGTWARARGWALWKALITLAGGGRGTPGEASPRRVIEEVLKEHREVT